MCLVIVDSLHHEEIWRRWCAQTSWSGYSAELYIHAKHPDRITSEWVKQRTLSYSFNPEWNSPEVIRAMLAVLRAAIDDTKHVNARFIFGTESCVPVCTLQQAGEALFSCDKSWCDAYMVAKDSYEDAHCFDAVNRHIIPRKVLLDHFLYVISVVCGQSSSWLDNAYAASCRRGDCTAHNAGNKRGAAC